MLFPPNLSAVLLDILTNPQGVLYRVDLPWENCSRTQLNQGNDER